jgi:protein-S-isoprenylcysteine O-methyltransferase Ste14
VRHPIYLAMLGLMIGTGLNLTHWVVLAGAAVLYLVGTGLRVRAEDGLLRLQFGDEFARYAAEVPALWPGGSRQASAVAR